MKKGVFLVLAFILFLIPLVFATETKIVINTAPNHDIIVSFLDIAGTQVLKKDKYDSGENGNISFSYISESNKIKMSVFVQKFGEKVELIDSNNPVAFDLELGGTQVFNVYPVGYEPIKAEVVEPIPEVIAEVENDTTIIAEEGNSGLTGQVVNSPSKKFKLSPIIYYVIAGFFLVGILLFIVTRSIKKRKSRAKPNDEIKVRKLSEMTSDRETVTNSEIEEAERKIMEAQAQINKLKNQEKIKMLENQMYKNQAELDRLRSGA